MFVILKGASTPVLYYDIFQCWLTSNRPGTDKGTTEASLWDKTIGNFSQPPARYSSAYLDNYRRNLVWYFPMILDLTLFAMAMASLGQAPVGRVGGLGILQTHWPAATSSGASEEHSEVRQGDSNDKVTCRVRLVQILNVSENPWLHWICHDPYRV